MSVVITSAASVKALAIARALGREGIKVIATDSERISPTFFSRFIHTYFITPSPKMTGTCFIETLYNHIRRIRPDVLMPVNSTETLLVSRFKSKFQGLTKVPFESYERLIQLHDKNRFYLIAKELDLPVPRTYHVEKINDLKKIGDVLEYPVVIKLRDATSSKGIAYANNKEEFIIRYKQIVEKYRLEPVSYPLIQEYIPGDGYGVSLLMNHGDLRAVFVHKRLREYPISGGPSSLRISVKHSKMEKIAIKLLEEIEWHGIAMIEFKLDERTGKPVIIEANPRFWGSINHAIISGVNFPYLLYRMAVDGDVEKVTSYNLNTVTMYFMNDVRAITSALLSGKVRMAFYIPKVNSIDEFALDDPLPAFIFPFSELKSILKNISKI